MTATTRIFATLLVAVALSLGVMTTMNSCATAEAGGQVEMNDALDHLRAARAALDRAEHNKGGHREVAIRLIDQAIAEVEAGKAVARERRW